MKAANLVFHDKQILSDLTSRSVLPHSSLVGINYFIKYMCASKGQSF